MTRFATSFFRFAQDVLAVGIPALCDAVELTAMRDLGAAGAHFYHYGLLPDSALECVATVLGRAA
jgi:hypothetical protein